MKASKATEEFAEMIDKQFLKVGGGNLNPTLDELAIAWQTLTSVSLIDALDFVNRRMPRALAVLEQAGWGVWVPYTSTFRTRGFAEPDDSDWAVLLSCVAGQGLGAQTVGYHFHVPASQECWMWEVWRDFYDKVGQGALQASRDNLRIVTDGHLQPKALTDPMVAQRLADAKGDTKELKALS